MTEIFGNPFAIKRYLRYDASYQWKFHSDYKTLLIERCYDGTQPKACYRAIYNRRNVVIVGEGLAQVKAAITRYFKELEL